MICANAFSNCALPSICVSRIPSEAGRGCLPEVPLSCGRHVRSGLKTRADRRPAFASSALQSICIPASVALIEYCCFDSCEELETVHFEEGSRLGRMDHFAFQFTKALALISLPAGVEIGPACFQHARPGQCFVSSAIPFVRASKRGFSGLSRFVNPRLAVVLLCESPPCGRFASCPRFNRSNRSARLQIAH